MFATDDGAGAIAGSFSTQVDGFPLDGTVTCLSVIGNTVVVGGSGTYWDGFDNVTRYQTMFFTDNGPTGTSDTAAVLPMTDTGPADCGVASPSQDALWYGQVEILSGGSDSGTVSGQGTSSIGGGSGTRTFQFDGERLAAHPRIGDRAVAVDAD